LGLESNTLGESDLIVLYEGSGNSRFAVLIEDKIDADLQPDQAERYRLRAERDCSEGLYSNFEVILCAPAFYLKNRGGLGGFDLQISLEQLADFLDTGDARAKYRASFLRTAAATKKINAWVREDDPATNAFWDAAYEVACQEFPILEMKPLRLTKGSVWITFRPHDLPTMPKHVYVSLKGQQGHIDLTFTKTTTHLFKPLVKHLLQPDMTVQKTGAAAAIRLKSPSFRIADGITEGLPRVKAAFAASTRLIEFYRAHSVELNQHAKTATPAL